MFSKNAITIQLIASVPLQFSTCLKNAIMYAKHCIGPTCRRIGLEKDREMLFLPSSSTSVFLLPLNGLNTRRRQQQLAAAAQKSRGGAARGSAHARRSSPVVELARGGTRARGRPSGARGCTIPSALPSGASSSAQKVEDAAAYGEAERGNSPPPPPAKSAASIVPPSDLRRPDLPHLVGSTHHLSSLPSMAHTGGNRRSLAASPPPTRARPPPCRAPSGVGPAPPLLAELLLLGLLCTSPLVVCPHGIMQMNRG
jgi:hypothetical protein